MLTNRGLIAGIELPSVTFAAIEAAWRSCGFSPKIAIPLVGTVTLLIRRVTAGANVRPWTAVVARSQRPINHWPNQTAPATVQLYPISRA